MAGPNDPIEVLLQSLKGGTKTALDEAGYGAGRGGFVAPMAPMEALAPTTNVAPQLSPTAKYIADMQALMSGGIGKLSTGEKLGALGQILQAAGSRGRADPAAVIQNVRNQQMQKLNAQYQIAQMQQKMQEEAQQRAAIEKYKVALEPEQINALEGLPLEKQAEKISEIAFRQDQVQQIKRADDGQTYILFASGKEKKAGFNLPKDYEKIDTGNGFKFVNKDNPAEFLKDASGKDLFIPKEMNAYQRETLDLRRQEIAKGGSGGGGGGGDLPRPNVQLFNGKPTLMQWDKNAPRPGTKKKGAYVPFYQPGISAPTRADMAITGLSPTTQGLLNQSLTVE